MTSLRNVAILVFDDVEILDFAGPYEVFNDAAEKTHPTAFNVYNIGISNQPIIGRGKFTVTPRYSIYDCPQADILIIPGGFGTRPLLKHEELIAWIADQSQKVEWLMSVCSGALLLAKAGLLKNCPATTHHIVFDQLRQISPTTTVVKDQRFVQASERIMTPAGVSAGIDLALYMLEKLTSAETCSAVKEEMEYQWDGVINTG
jgi:transcriptional regulator GlxA family with amidase domain